MGNLVHNMLIFIESSAGFFCSGRCKSMHDLDLLLLTYILHKLFITHVFEQSHDIYNHCGQ